MFRVLSPNITNMSFHDVVPTNGTMNNFKCNITSNGIAEWLLQTMQLFVYNVHKTNKMFLATNKISTISKYYKDLKFQGCDLWNMVGKEVTDCAILESIFLLI